MNLSKRKKEHLRNKSNDPFHNSLRRNPDAFVWEILHEDEEEKLRDYEQMILDGWYGSKYCYNLKGVAAGSNPELGRRAAAATHARKDESGKSIVAKKAGAAMNRSKHSMRDEHGRSVAAKSNNFGSLSKPIEVTHVSTGQVFEFRNSVDAALYLNVSSRGLRKVASGQIRKHMGYTARFTTPG